MSFPILKSALRRLFVSPLYAGLNILGLGDGGGDGGEGSEPEAGTGAAL